MVEEKGFVLTVDAFLSVTLILLFIILSFFYLSKTSVYSWNAVDLRLVTGDELAVLEKGGVLESAIKQSSSEGILSALNDTPNSYCFSLTVYDYSAALAPKLNSVKSGCAQKGNDVSSVERTIISRNASDINFYIARLEGWRK